MKLAYMGVQVKLNQSSIGIVVFRGKRFRIFDNVKNLGSENCY